MIINFAYAQATAASGGQGLLVQLLPLILIFVVFYFLLIRPQQKRQKEHKILLESIKRNDEIMTSGGILGRVLKVDGDKLSVEIAKGVNVTVMRSTVADVINKK